MDIFRKAFSECLDGQLISVTGGEWCRYFFVVEVKADELLLVNNAGDTTELHLRDVTEKGIVVQVIELPKLIKM